MWQHGKAASPTAHPIARGSSPGNNRVHVPWLGNCGTNSSASFSQHDLIACKFIPPYTMSVDALLFENTAGTDNTETTVVGIYDDTGAGLPNALKATGAEVTLGAAADVNIATFTAITLTKDTPYWLAQSFNSGITVLNALALASSVSVAPLDYAASKTGFAPWAADKVASSSGLLYPFIYTTHTYNSALPDPFPAINAFFSTCTLIGVQEVVS